MGLHPGSTVPGSEVCRSGGRSGHIAKCRDLPDLRSVTCIRSGQGPAPEHYASSHSSHGRALVWSGRAKAEIGELVMLQ